VSGESFGPYVLHECLGAGGMAIVHRATKEIGAGVVREVALKRLLPQLANDKLFTEDFIREAKLAAQLDHPNIVHILELGEVDGTYFIAMELVRGASLVQLMKQAYATKLTAPIGVVLSLICELCDALDYAANGRGIYGQALRIIHRDLTPSNLMLTDEGRIKIIDFGVAKAMSGKFMTNTGMIKGKLGYMSPEALAGGKAIDGRTDIFSVGVVAWELLAGRRLFRGINEYEVITKIRSGEIPPPSVHNFECPDALDEIVLGALARSLDERWQDAASMRAALDRLRPHFSDGPPQVAAWKEALIPIERSVRQDTTTDSHEALTVGRLLAEGSVRQPSESMEITGVHAPTDERTRNELPSGRASTHDDDEATTLDAVISRPSSDGRD
jgi:eukaryotic-like serine/threonine-protein kinase